MREWPVDLLVILWALVGLVILASLGYCHTARAAEDCIPAHLVTERSYEADADSETAVFKCSCKSVCFDPPQEPPACPADLTGDTVVGTPDFVLFNEAQRGPCPTEETR